MIDSMSQQNKLLERRKEFYIPSGSVHVMQWKLQGALPYKGSEHHAAFALFQLLMQEKEDTEVWLVLREKGLIL